jgi:hypothetical protein
MRTFAPKQNQPPKRVSSNLARSNTKTPGSNHHTDPILHWQRTISNQALQRLLQTDAEELEGGSTNTALPRFAHDFSRIPVHARTPVKIQTRLTVNAPGDICEQEADRVADQVMRIPAPQLQRACPCGGGCPNCQTEQPGPEHERVHTKGVQSDTSETTVPPIVHNVLSGPGQPLDPATRALMEPRFGRDFGHVRIHSNEKAAEAARTLDAKAFTVGRDMVFGAGQYALQAAEGRRLVAHELTHVLQQGTGSTVLQRTPDDETQSTGNLALPWTWGSFSLFEEESDGVRFLVGVSVGVSGAPPLSQLENDAKAAIPAIRKQIAADNLLITDPAYRVMTCFIVDTTTRFAFWGGQTPPNASS